MGARDDFDDRETETRAAATAGLVGAAETVERAGTKVLGKARAGVGHVELYDPIVLLRPELDGTIAVRERVVDEVHEGLADPEGIGVDMEVGGLDQQLPAE